MKRSFFLLVLPAAFLLSCSGDNASRGIPDSVANSPLVWVLEDVTGTVLVQSSGEAFANPVTEGQAVHQGDEVITRDASEAVLTLNETTLFRVSGNSDVKVNQLVWNSTGGFVSRLELTAGKVLSEVEKLSEHQSSFEVQSGGVICGVRGTSFEVADTDSGVEDSTFEGDVELSKDGNTQSVGAGEHGGYSPSQNGFTPKRPCTQEEKAAYGQWRSKRDYVRGKTRQRWNALRTQERMPPEERRKFPQEQQQKNERNGGQPPGPNRPEPVNPQSPANNAPPPQGRAGESRASGQRPEGGGREPGQAPHSPPPREHH